MKWVKKIALGAVIVFVVFFVVTRPEDAANFVQGTVEAVYNATTAIGQFFSTLASS